MLCHQKMRRTAVFLPVWLALVFCGCRGSAVEGAADELLTTGRRLYKQGEFKEARRHFHGVRKYHPAAVQAEEALLYVAPSFVCKNCVAVCVARCTPPGRRYVVARGFMTKRRRP